MEGKRGNAVTINNLETGMVQYLSSKAKAKIETNAQILNKKPQSFVNIDLR